jgi:hypothetical protein
MIFSTSVQGNEHGPPARQQPVGSKGDARVVGAERHRGKGQGKHCWYCEQDAGQHGAQQGVPEQAQANQQQADGQAPDGAATLVAFFVAARVRQHVFPPLTVGLVGPL